jgi:superfamily II DNA or RNA helicase
MFVNVEGTKSALTFTFPDTYSQDKVRIVNLWKETAAHLLVPRAFWDPASLPYRVVDLRPTKYPKVDIRSKIKLDHRWRETPNGKVLTPTGDCVQQNSLDALLASTGGGLQLACGKGKTIVFLELLAVLKMPGLIVVPDTTLMEQWRSAINDTLIVPDGIGLIQGAKNDWQKPIVLTTYHTIGLRAAKGLPMELMQWFATTGWDEGHHISAPMFAPSAPALPGRRFYLTATPERDDGMHILVDYHIGGVLYKDLTQDLKPRIFFRWTGLKLDEDRTKAARDINGEVHLSKLAGVFAQWQERMDMVLDDIQFARDNGRKVLLLSNSEAEIVNLATLWESRCTGKKPGKLFTDIPAPTIKDIGEIIAPVEIHPMELSRLTTLRDGLELKMEVETDPEQFRVLSTMFNEVCAKLYTHEVHKKLELQLDRLQKAHVKKLIPKLKNCGIIIHKVPPKKRREFINERKVTFAIMKYGKEGLDAEALDTVLVSTPFSSKNGLQQLMGRPTRDFVGKKTPTIVFYVDNVGPLIGMCKKLMSHLGSWVHEEGGPFEYEKIDYLNSRRGTWQQNLMRVFGP